MGLSSQQQVHFDTSQDRFKPRVEITGHPGVDWGEKGIPLRVYPAGCQIKCTSGTVSLDAAREVTIPGDFVSFSGNSSSLRYQPSSPPTVELVWGFDELGNPVGNEVVFKVNTLTGTITASKKFTGLVKVGPYPALYQLIWYRPETKIFNQSTSQFPGMHVEYGVICAYKDGGIALHQVELPTIRQGTDKIELWRVVSNTVIDPDGEWEYPSNWSTYTGKYADNKTGPNKDSSAVKERVHEIGYMTATGSVVWYDAFPKFLLQPYQAPTQAIKATGMIGFQPVVTIRDQLGSVASLFPDNMGAQNAAKQAIADRKAMPLIR